MIDLSNISDKTSACMCLGSRLSSKDSDVSFQSDSIVTTISSEFKGKFWSGVISQLFSSTIIGGYGDSS